MRSTLLTLVAVTALAACGGGDADNTGAGPATGAPTTTAPAGTTPTAASSTPPVALTGTVDDRGTKALGSGTALSLDLGDFYFAPTYVTAKAGTKLTVTLENTGSAPHTFTSLDPNVDVSVDPGKKGTATLTLPASGTVAFYCRFHRTQGMQGGFAVS